MIYLSVNGRLMCERIITNFDSALGPPEPITEGDDSPVLDRYPDREPDDLEVPHAPDIGLHDRGGLVFGASALLGLGPCGVVQSFGGI